MGKYTQEQNDAYNDILEAGTLAQISRVVSTYDETEGEQTVTAVQTDPVAVVNLPASESLSQQRAEGHGSACQAVPRPSA